MGRAGPVPRPAGTARRGRGRTGGAELVRMGAGWAVTYRRAGLRYRLMDGHRIIEVNGVDLCVDTAGDAADPAILLIGGMGSSMDWWEEEFCQRLAAGGRF